MTPQGVSILLREQARACRRAASPLYAALLENAAADVLAGGPAWGVLRGQGSVSPAWSLPLRLMRSVHRLVLAGRAPRLARFYPSAGGRAVRSAAWPAFAETLAEHRDALRKLLRRPLQTNEVGRSAALLGGFLLVARETRLPLRLLEIGASAGLNLRWDRYCYQSRGQRWGSRNSPVRFTRVFAGKTPPLGVAARVVERRGCDRAPLNPSSRDGRLTLLSHVWADQRRRFQLLRGALAVAAKVPCVVDRADAPAWLADALKHPVPGVATVVFHSSLWGQLSAPARARIRMMLLETGRCASAASPLAWLSMEGGWTRAQVRLSLWPGGFFNRLLATSAVHGPPVRWRAR